MENKTGIELSPLVLEAIEFYFYHALNVKVVYLDELRFERGLQAVVTGKKRYRTLNGMGRVLSEGWLAAETFNSCISGSLFSEITEHFPSTLMNEISELMKTVLK